MLFRNLALKGNLICIISFSWGEKNLDNSVKEGCKSGCGNQEARVTESPQCNGSCFLNLFYIAYTMICSIQKITCPQILTKVMQKKIYEGAELP